MQDLFQKQIPAFFSSLYKTTADFMITLSTPTELPKNMPEITHEQHLMLIGSCFAENIGNLLTDNGFCCDVNPFGIQYNPLSIRRALERIEAGNCFTEEDLFFYKGYWHSYMHHSSFSAETPEAALDAINNRLQQAHQELQSANWLIMTWGTSYVYALDTTGEIVSNCHKQPERMFQRRRITTEEIVSAYRPMLEQLFKSNRELRVLITVSPIRHQRDGMHANQLSKATLLLAVDQLCTEYPGQVFYFPSYEIVLDELRDYRFYAEDMVHLSDVAVNYIWERFSEVFFSKQTRQTITEYTEIKRGLSHRPFHPESEEYQSFLRQISLKINRFKKKYPKFAIKID